jgi:hypothetical protein
MAENMRGPRLSLLMREKVYSSRVRRGVKRSPSASGLPVSLRLRRERFEAAASK